MAPSKQTRREAAAILNRIADTLPLPPRVESYLRGYAAGLKR